MSTKVVKMLKANKNVWSVVESPEPYDEAYEYFAGAPPGLEDVEAIERAIEIAVREKITNIPKASRANDGEDV